jgi:hypothetical protein
MLVPVTVLSSWMFLGEVPIVELVAARSWSAVCSTARESASDDTGRDVPIER